MTVEQFEQKQREMPNEELYNLVQQQLSKLCKTGGKSLIMSVPPRVDDFDIIVSELLRRFKDGE